MKGKAARVSCRETRFLPASSLPVLHLIVAGKITLGAGHRGSRSMGWSLPSHAAGPALPLAQPGKRWRGGRGPWGAFCWILHRGGKWAQLGQEGSEAFGKAGAERSGWTGRVEGAHRPVPFPVLYLVIGGDCPPQLTTLIVIGI